MDKLAEVEIKVIPFHLVKPMPNNPRIIKEENLAGLKASLERFGYVEPIVWNEDTGHIVGGHQRFKVMVMKNLKEAPMVIVHLSEDEEMAANLTLNNPEIEGEYTPKVLELMKAIKVSDGGLFEKLNMDDLLEKLEKRFTPGSDRSFANKEVNIEDLIEGCDSKCPCCGFMWESDGKDMVDITGMEGGEK
jgi:hypothetical protein